MRKPSHGNGRATPENQKFSSPDQERSCEAGRATAGATRHSAASFNSDWPGLTRANTTGSVEVRKPSAIARTSV